jgi:hypothetical protein
MAWTEDSELSEPPMKRREKIPRKRFYAKDLPSVQSLCQIAEDLPSWSGNTVTWREEIKRPLSSRFARVVVWVASGLTQGKMMKEQPEELLIEWPEGDKEPLKY